VNRLAPVPAVLLALALAAPGCITRQRAEKAIGHQTIAQVYFDEQEYAGAIGELEESIRLNPYIPESHHLLANCYFATQRFEEADGSFRTATRLDPRYAEAFVNWGALLIQQERWEDAVEKLSVAADEPTYREVGRALHNLGWAYYNLGRYEEAEDCYKRLLRVTPLFCPSLHNLGMVSEAQGQLDEAETHYQRSLECNETHLDTWMALGRLYIRLDRVEDARFHLDFVAAHDDGGTLGDEALALLSELPAAQPPN